MQHDREAQTASVLTNGKVLVTGGVSSYSNSLRYLSGISIFTLLTYNKRNAAFIAVLTKAEIIHSS